MSKFKIVLLAVAVLVAGWFGYSWIRRYFQSDESRIREVVLALASDVESDNIILSHLRMKSRLSEKYQHRGEALLIDRNLALVFIEGTKQQVKNVKVEIREMTITVSGDTAKVILTGRVTATSPDNPSKREEILTQPGINRCQLDFAKEDGSWVVVGSERIAYDLPPDPAPK